MIIDSHAHAWSKWPYEPPVPDPGSRGCVEQLLWEMDRHDVNQAVLVSARIEHNPDNNTYVAEAVRAHPDRLHQFVDVDSKWSSEYHTPGAADRLASAADRYHPAGITHYLGSTNDGWLISDDGMGFFAEATARRLIMSIAGAPVWQPDLRKVAHAFPDLPILCHHLAGIPSFAHDREAGLAMVLASAKTRNIMVKVSGFYYGSPTPFDYPHASAIACFESLYRAFGAERLVWGSDYPVAPARAYTYRQSLEILRHHCGFVSPDDMAKILGGTIGAILRTGQTPPLPFREFTDVCFH